MDSPRSHAEPGCEPGRELLLSRVHDVSRCVGQTHWPKSKSATHFLNDSRMCPRTYVWNRVPGTVPNSNGRRLAWLRHLFACGENVLVTNKLAIDGGKLLRTPTYFRASSRGTPSG